MPHLSRGHDVLHRVDRETEDVVRVPGVKPLSMFFTAIHNAKGSHMVHYVPVLHVEEVVTAVVATIPASNQSFLHYIMKVSCVTDPVF